MFFCYALYPLINIKKFMLLKNIIDNKVRCFGNNSELYAKYHDEEWGVAKHDELTLFEFLILEGAQAGLSWYTVLKKREGYRLAFKNFDVKKVALMTDKELESLMGNKQIIRNRLKIYSARKNAQIFLNIQNHFGSFDKYIWRYVNYQAIINQFKDISELPSKSNISDEISKDLKKRGMSFIGSTIMYAYMQAIGMVDDHLHGCHKRQQI